MRVLYDFESWPHVLNDDQEELEAMKEYWGDEYFDVPDDLYHRYLKAIKDLEELVYEIEKLVPPKKESESKGFIRFEWKEDELDPLVMHGEVAGVKLKKVSTPFGDLTTIEGEGT